MKKGEGLFLKEGKKEDLNNFRKRSWERGGSIIRVLTISDCETSGGGAPEGGEMENGGTFWSIL